MRFLFIVQGEGRGHFTQALTMKELLHRRGDEVVGILVGKSESRQLPEFFVKKIGVPVWTFPSPNFLPTPQNKRPGLVKSVCANIGRLPAFARSMRTIRRKIGETEPDMVINFYELLAGFTYLLAPPRVPLVCIGHQYLFLHRDFGFPPSSSPVELFFLRFFTRLTSMGAVRRLALSFYPLAADGEVGVEVVPPLIRREVRRQQPEPGDYILGYMLNSGYAAEVEAWHRAHPAQPLHFFWDKKDAPERLETAPGLEMHRIDDALFVQYMAGCRAYSTTAGFESVCEAAYLRKPVVMIPVHVEQECNAWDAMRTGAGIVASSFDLDGLLEFIPEYHPDENFRDWADCAEGRIYAVLRQIAAEQPDLPGLSYFQWLRYKFSYAFW